ncbi:G protein-regulated inducer of neurite outgrowth 1 [Thalassophryne amazonica]|uniref:G protein-regulated inducer of neurite outgrowth 1 n=1 Tax=Thalassophryne amazonica TaxID=390379 RepID=UPI0014711DAA|nr:G protein-regulated inducer of neurite outgrowth 1 [Thalassophryne amazonica]
MGSLKDDMKGLREDCQPCEKTADGEQMHGSDSRATPQGVQMNTSQVSEIQGDRHTKLHSSCVEESNGDPVSKESVLSRQGLDIDDHSGSQERTQTESEEDKSPTATQNDVTVASQSASNEFLSEVSPGDRRAQMDQDPDKKLETHGISVPVPSTPDVFDPYSPAPFGQHHMRTQVNLDVVQCRSAATSPMTPPGGGNSFFFPSSFGKSGPVGSGSKDAELQVGHQVEFCSVATSPMTPKTPMTTAFPELVGKETQQKMKGESRSGQEKRFSLTESATECQSERTEAERSASKEVTAGSDASAESFPAGATNLQVTLQDGNQQCQQQRMRSMDQDITILVTHHGNDDDDDDEDKEEGGEMAEPIYPIETEMVKIDVYEEFDDNSKKTNNVQKNEGNDEAMKISAGTSNVEDTSSTNVSHQEQSDDSSDVKENKDACVGEELKDLTKPPIPESPAPFGFHNIRTQVSLEVVQCHSAATSPMTPPEGDQVFSFPTCLGRSVAMATETKDAEMQVGQQVEFRSIATAPMTPRTPTATAFPEIQKEASIEEKTVEDEEEKRDVKEQVSTKTDGEAKEEEEMSKSAEEKKNCKERG